MSGIQQVLLGGAPSAYQIERSLRFNSADSAYLNRTFGSGDQQKFTLNLWVKRSESGARSIFTCGSSGSSYVQFRFNSGDTLYLASENTSLVMQLETTQVFRDYSAWYMITLAVDTTQATSSNRVKLYVNGSQVTAFSTATYPAQNTNLLINSNIAHYLGTVSYSTGTNLYGGYLTEVNFVGAQQLTPSSFGQTNASTGVWEPIAYTGTYGTNGYFLKFADNSNTTAATLGKDSSGNGNNWTPNNFSVTAGAGNDSLVDTPTSYGTDTGAGGEVRGNYCTWNPLSSDTSFSITNGNLDVSSTSSESNSKFLKGSLGVSSGKWYWEVIPSNVAAGPNFTTGIQSTTVTATTGTVNSLAGGYGYYAAGQKEDASGQTSYGDSYTANDVIGIALDLDAGTIVFYKNGVSQGTAFSSLSGTFVPVINFSTSGSSRTIAAVANFGQRPFAYTAPSGFKALCTQNLPTPTIGATSTTQANDYMNVVLYTGNEVQDRTISGVGFQPDFVWIKNRGTTSAHVLFNAVAGGDKQLFSNLTDAEQTNNDITNGFASDGFIVGDNVTGTGSTNQNTNTYVAWNWNAGGSNATNTSGTITSTVRASTTAGFSIVTYTGTGSAATIGHGLGVAPKMIIVKSRDQGTTGYTGNWYVYHASNTAAPETDYLLLNTTAATADDTFWNDTAPTSTIFSVGALSGTNDSSDKFVAYCFAEVAGYSAFGSYTGNGNADGPFVFVNHRPAFLLIKRTDTTSNWTILDFQREGYNVDNDPLYPNLSDAEGTADLADLLSNGFKLRSTDASVNASGGTYIYMSLAQNPFKYSLAR